MKPSTSSLLRWLKDQVASPRSDDPVESYRTSTSRFVAFTLTASGFLVSAVLIVAALLGNDPDPPNLVRARILTAVGATLLTALPLVLIRRGLVKPANALMVFVAYAGVTAGVSLGGGFHSPGLPAFVIVVVLAGVLLGRRAAVGWSALSLVTVTGLGAFPPPDELDSVSPDHLARHVGALVVVVGIAGAILIRWSSRLNAALAAESEQLTALEQRDRERRASEARFHGIANQARDLITEIDETGRVVYASPNHREVMGYPPEEIVGHPSRDFVHPDDLDEQPWRVVDGRIELPLCRMRAADGSYRWLEASACHYTTASGARHLISISRDITKRIESAREQRLRDAAISQAQKMEALGRLAGGITHDFNNLMTVITLNVEHLDHELGQDPLASRLLGQIRDSASQAIELTRRLLSFARPTKAEIEIVDLNAQVEDVARLLRPLVGEDVDLELCLEPGAGCVEADRSEIGQVVMNLVVNAKEAVPRGGSIWVETVRLDLREPMVAAGGTLPPGPYLGLSVTDSGAGMEAEDLERVFEPFFTTKSESGGTGLGLAMVYAIVHGAGGDVMVSSEPGRGTRVEVLLPRIDGVAPDTEDETPSRPVACGKETLFLVEDQPGVLRVTARLLRSYGYEVIEASSGDQALALERGHEGPIDLLLTDVVMPGLRGPELAREFLARRPGTRVIYLTGYGGEHFDLGVRPDHPLLLKPVAGNVLAAKVREVLDEPEAS
ncbi:MAG: ATP-binding protein [Myxococcota bacterium]|nr:ATP-binding protein [Myxococcota bacterium]